MDDACTRWGLAIGKEKKPEILHQPSQSLGIIPIILGDIPLKITDNFVYLGSMITSDGNLDGEIQKRLASANPCSIYSKVECDVVQVYPSILS